MLIFSSMTSAFVLILKMLYIAHAPGSKIATMKSGKVVEYFYWDS